MSTDHPAPDATETAPGSGEFYVHVEPQDAADQSSDGANAGRSGATPQQRQAVDLADLLRHEFPPREYLLAPVLTLGSLNMLFAWRGIGKTHASLGIAYAAASGGSFWGWEASRPFRVLYLDGEMPGEAIQSRLASIVSTADQEPPPDYFRLLTIDLQGGAMPDLGTPHGQAQVADECERAELIVLDNLSCLVRSGRENEADGWAPVADWALSLRSRGKCVLFVHHAGKAGQQRGTSRREDLLDTSISLKRPPDYEADQGARFQVRFDKARHMSGKDAQPFEAWLQQDEHGNPAWTTRPVAETTYEQVVEMAGLGMSQKEIADELGINRSNVSRAWNRAVEAGLIRSKQGGKRPEKDITQKARRVDIDE